MEVHPISDHRLPRVTLQPFTAGEGQNLGRIFFLSRCGANMERHIRAIFQRWGTWCAYHPWTVIIICIVIVTALSCGLLFFKVITNPVDLWSAPKSTAREQRAYFDKTFGPFYRTEQVIITAEPSSEIYKIYPRDDIVHFDGIVHKEMLHKVFLLSTYLLRLFGIMICENF